MRKANDIKTKMAVRRYLLSLDDIVIVEMKQKFLKERGQEIPEIGRLNACIKWLQDRAINCEHNTVKTIELLADWLDDTFDNQWDQYIKHNDNQYWLLIAREIIASK